jgi:hypothetical protein
LVRYAVFFGIVSVSAAAAWFIVDSGWIDRRGESIPIVHANKDPIKVKPDSPGGMAVPDRDKLVYDRLAPGSAPSTVEQLLPRAETPIAPPQDVSRAESEHQPVPALPPVMPEGTPPSAARTVPPPSPQQVEPVTPKNMLPVRPTEEEKRTPPPSAPSAAKTPVREAPVKEMPGKQAEPEKKQTFESMESLIAKTTETPPVPPSSSPSSAAATPPATPAPGSASGEPYRVQLAAVRSRDRAEKEWERIKTKNDDVLGKLSLSVMRADLGARGVYFRLRAGPLASETEARAVCDKLSARKVPCLVVRPNG